MNTIHNLTHDQLLTLQDLVRQVLSHSQSDEDILYYNTLLAKLIKDYD
tara:strand:- start:1137 stop:1280 length:144 start_codon:yes stop_codon:yes gene_type:complete